MKMSKYCDNCGRRSHCGTSLNEILEPGRDGNGTLVKICDNCRCDQCTSQINEDENRYSDESICTPTAKEIENHYYSAPWVVYFRDLGIDWATGKPIES